MAWLDWWNKFTLAKINVLSINWSDHWLRYYFFDCQMISSDLMNDCSISQKKKKNSNTIEDSCLFGFIYSSDIVDSHDVWKIWKIDSICLNHWTLEKDRFVVLILGTYQWCRNEDIFKCPRGTTIPQWKLCINDRLTRWYELKIITFPIELVFPTVRTLRAAMWCEFTFVVFIGLSIQETNYIIVLD